MIQVHQQDTQGPSYEQTRWENLCLRNQKGIISYLFKENWS